MIQNIITLIIVYSAAAWAVYSVYVSIKYKKASKCDGCSGSCAIKDHKLDSAKMNLLESKPNKIDNFGSSSKHLHVI